MPLLSTAVSKGDYNQVKVALEKKEDVNQIVDKEENTPLLIALKKGFYDIAKLLIIKGADIWKKNKKEENAGSLCPFALIKEVISESRKINLFLNRKKISNSLWDPNYQLKKNKDDINMILAMNCNLEEKDQQGNTFLLKAASDPKNFPSYIELLIRAGADSQAKNNKGENLDIIISRLPIKKTNQKIEAIKNAVKKNNTLKTNKTLLILAVTEGLYNQTSIAIRNQEDVNQLCNENKDTPLMIALKNGHWHIAMLLIENNASILLKNKQNMSAIDIAHQMKMPKIVAEVLFADNKNNHQRSSTTSLWKKSETAITKEENLILYYSTLNQLN